MDYLNSPAFRTICRILVVTMLSLGLPVRFSHAGVIGTDVVVAAAQSSEARTRVQGFLDRADVRAQLAAQGVSPELAKQRVDSLSDEEIQRVAGKIDSLPAGGADILGVLLVVFLILLLTDILGLTKVFPFTRPLR